MNAKLFLYILSVAALLCMGLLTSMSLYAICGAPAKHVVEFSAGVLGTEDNPLHGVEVFCDNEVEPVGTSVNGKIAFSLEIEQRPGCKASRCNTFSFRDPGGLYKPLDNIRPGRVNGNKIILLKNTESSCVDSARNWIYFYKFRVRAFDTDHRLLPSIEARCDGNDQTMAVSSDDGYLEFDILEDRGAVCGSGCRRVRFFDPGSNSRLGPSWEPSSINHKNIVFLRNGESDCKKIEKELRNVVCYKPW